MSGSQPGSTLGRQQIASIMPTKSIFFGRWSQTEYQCGFAPGEAPQALTVGQLGPDRTRHLTHCYRCNAAPRMCEPRENGAWRLALLIDAVHMKLLLRAER